MQRLQEYTRQSSQQVSTLLARRDMPTDLQLNRYMSEFVRNLKALAVGAPNELHREVVRLFEGLWNFENNAPLRGSPLRVFHLAYVLRELEALLHSGRDFCTEAKVREVGREVRRLIARAPFDRIERDLLAPDGLLVCDICVRCEFTLAPDRSHHTFSWSFRVFEREVQEAVLYWDEHFDYGGESSDGESDDAMSEAALDASMDDPTAASSNVAAA